MQRVVNTLSHRTLPTKISGWPLVVIFLFAVGCGQPDVGSDVQGKVTFDGKSVDGGVVLFNPLNADLPPIRANIQSDGAYQLKAEPAEYKVIVKWYEKQSSDIQAEDPRYQEPKLLTPKEYTSLQTTPLQFKVVKEKEVIDLDL
ncbi:hypothetical protein [Blastopirellula marina]|uniref:Carboxypeptidase regulatory-like domain-containing protein n=1 Tax=Blastopirellula marina DSM 3645 TaxID=314230 RepID=A3ZY22_9BACT|nr:hypothetical protein [Blastopirellula marina]EAQ78508.1 hypothetical protein DSM3645_26534 [Blastopirellula marina DSM 3645]